MAAKLPTGKHDIMTDNSKTNDKAGSSATGDEVLGDQAWRRTGVTGRYFEPTYSGAVSFLRRPYREDLSEAEIAVVGVPFDSAVTYRPGCRLGPRAIRAASVQLAELKAFPSGRDPFETLSVVDHGDIVLNPHDPATIEEDIYRAAKSVIDTGTKMLSLGGDHFIAYPLLKAHAEAYGPLALLQFDAHCDTWPAFGPLDHGTMFLRAVEEGLIDTKRSVQVGLRTHNDLDVGIQTITAPQVHKFGVEAALSQIQEIIGDAATYVSFDIDVLDPAFAPGTGTPVAGGLASWQALELIRGCGKLQMVGFDLVEVSPPFDHAEITALAAATIAHDWLDVMAGQK